LGRLASGPAGKGAASRQIRPTGRTARDVSRPSDRQPKPTHRTTPHGQKAGSPNQLTAQRRVAKKQAIPTNPTCQAAADARRPRSTQPNPHFTCQAAANAARPTSGQPSPPICQAAANDTRPRSRQPAPLHLPSRRRRRAAKKQAASPTSLAKPPQTPGGQEAGSPAPPICQTTRKRLTVNKQATQPHPLANPSPPHPRPPPRPHPRAPSKSPRSYRFPPAAHWSQGICQSPSPSQDSKTGPPLFWTTTTSPLLEMLCSQAAASVVMLMHP
jgi:hypothetical protein